MINQALILRSTLYIIASSDQNLKKYVLSDNKWNCIKEIHKFLQIYNLLKKFFLYKYTILIKIILLY